MSSFCLEAMDEYYVSYVISNDFFLRRNLFSVSHDHFHIITVITEENGSAIKWNKITSFIMTGYLKRMAIKWFFFSKFVVRNSSELLDPRSQPSFLLNFVFIYSFWWLNFYLKKLLYGVFSIQNQLCTQQKQLTKNIVAFCIKFKIAKIMLIFLPDYAKKYWTCTHNTRD